MGGASRGKTGRVDPAASRTEEIIVVVVMMTAISPTAVVPRVIPSAVPSAVPSSIVPRVVPSAVIPRISPTPGVTKVPRVVAPRRIPSSVVPRIRSPVDRAVERPVPVPIGRAVPRLVGAPGVEPVVVKIDGCGVVRVVEIYSCRLVLRDEQRVDFLSALHKDRGTLGLRH